MTTLQRITALAALLPASLAHFVIQYPGTRGLNEETHAEWPCGGFNTVSSNRSEFPLSGAPIQIESTHTESYWQVVLAIGNEPGDSYEHVLVPTLQQQGPQQFCFGEVNIPASLNITAGTNGTIQVIGSGHSGGLYACADVTFTDVLLTEEQRTANCVNSTGVTVIETNIATNANETSHEEHDESETSATATATDAAATSTPTDNAASVQVQATGLTVVICGILFSWLTLM